MLGVCFVSCTRVCWECVREGVTRPTIPSSSSTCIQSASSCIPSFNAGGRFIPICPMPVAPTAFPDAAAGLLMILLDPYPPAAGEVSMRASVGRNPFCCVVAAAVVVWEDRRVCSSSPGGVDEANPCPCASGDDDDDDGKGADDL